MKRIVHWTDEQVQILTDMHAAKWPIRAIAAKVGRTTHAVKHKLGYLHITDEQRAVRNANTRRRRAGAQRYLQRLRANRPEHAPEPAPEIEEFNVDATHQWSEAEYQAMDTAFCRAMIDALDAGQEQATVGIVTTPQTDMARTMRPATVHAFGNCALAD